MSKLSAAMQGLNQRYTAYLESHQRAHRIARWMHNPKHWKNLLWAIARYVLLIGLSYIVLSPLFFMITMSIRSPWDNMDPSVVWIPRNFSTQVFSLSFETMQFWPSLWETLKTNVFTGLLQVASTCVIGYGFARFKFPGRGLIFGAVIFTLIVPMQTIMSGYYMVMFNMSIFGIQTGLSLMGTYWAFWLPALLGFGIRSGIFIYFYRQFFRGQPKELSEAATVDGCGYIGTFLRIMLPGAVSVIITVFLFALVWQWNDNYLTSYFEVHQDRTTLAMQLSAFPAKIQAAIRDSADNEAELGNPSNEYTMISMTQASCMIMIAPVLLIYIFLQRYFTESISRSGIVG